MQYLRWMMVICLLLIEKSYVLSNRYKNPFQGFFSLIKKINRNEGGVDDIENLNIEHSKAGLPPELTKFLFNTAENLVQGVIYSVAIRLLLDHLGKAIESTTKGFTRRGNENIPNNIAQYLNSNFSLNSHELELVSSITDPLLIKENMSDIGGLKDAKVFLSEIIDTSKETFSQSNPLFTATMSILLYGPPGCGNSIIFFNVISLISSPNSVFQTISRENNACPCSL
jgi:hypothetical protein